MEIIPFNKPYLTGDESKYFTKALEAGKFSGGGQFEQLCHTWLESHLKANKVLLAHSCTAALEMAAILADIQLGDEIIMPSYTFVSTANAFVLRGGMPVFVDIRDDTLNIDEEKIEDAITERTKAIVVVHYAGTACEMDIIMEIARRYNLIVIEDAAQALMSYYKNRPLGSIGDLAAFSFHDTKNIISGEGGALVINNEKYAERAEIIREKGTNRRRFLRGEVDKYSWVDIGSSFLPGEITAAFLLAQLENAQVITDRRLEIWRTYDHGFRSKISRNDVKLPQVFPHISHNAHMYYLIFQSLETRAKIISFLKAKGIHSVFHYLPLHNSEFGLKHCRVSGDLPNTIRVADGLLRLPFWVNIEEFQPRIIETVLQSLAEQDSV